MTLCFHSTHYTTALDGRAPLPQPGWVQVEWIGDHPDIIYRATALDRPRPVDQFLALPTYIPYSPHSTGYQLPRPLEELSEKEDGTPVPFIIDKEIVERERATLAWYCRHIMNMYAYVFKYAGTSDEELLFVTRFDPTESVCGSSRTLSLS